MEKLFERWTLRARCDLPVDLPIMFQNIRVHLDLVFKAKCDYAVDQGQR